MRLGNDLSAQCSRRIHIDIKKAVRGIGEYDVKNVSLPMRGIVNLLN